jgi:hypothetical protein
MKKSIFVLALAVFWLHSDAQLPLTGVITTVVKKLINSLDLEVEQLQNQTIWLQNAQKTLENTMSQIQLDGIASWVRQTKDLYSEYYQELSSVKQVITDYDRVKQIITLQTNLLTDYRSAYSRFKQDKNFTLAEINNMYTVYTGIIAQSLKNMDQVLLVVNPFVTQMTDEGRLNIINQAAVNMQKNYNDLKAFNNQNLAIGLQRAGEKNDIQTIKNLYGLP